MHIHDIDADSFYSPCFHARVVKELYQSYIFSNTMTPGMHKLNIQVLVNLLCSTHFQSSLHQISQYQLKTNSLILGVLSIDTANPELLMLMPDILKWNTHCWLVNVGIQIRIADSETRWHSFPYETDLFIEIETFWCHKF